MSFSKNHWLALFLGMNGEKRMKGRLFVALVFGVMLFIYFNFWSLWFHIIFMNKIKSIRVDVYNFKPTPYALTVMPFNPFYTITNENSSLLMGMNYKCISSEKNRYVYEGDEYIFAFINTLAYENKIKSDYGSQMIGLQDSVSNYLSPSDVGFFEKKLFVQNIVRSINAKCLMYGDVTDGIYVTNEYGAGVLSWRKGNEKYMFLYATSKDHQHGYNVMIKSIDDKVLNVELARDELLKLWAGIRWNKEEGVSR